MKSRTLFAKACPSAVAMFLPSRFRQASFMPTRPMVEKWFFQNSPNRSLTLRR